MNDQPAAFFDNVQSPTRQRINPWKLFLAAMIPNWLLCREEISPGAKLCYARLAQYAGQNGSCFPKQSSIASELGVSERSVRNYLAELEKFELIECEQQGQNQSNLYFFLNHEWMAENAKTRLKRPAKISEPDRQELAGPDRQNSSAPNSEEIQLNESLPLGPLKGDVSFSSSLNEKAETIYQVYPKKVGKPAAIRKITKAIQKHGFDLVLERTRLFAQTYNGDPQFIPHPSTWFSQERFNDNSATWRRTQQTNTIRRKSANNEDAAELDQIRAELQWQKDPLRIHQLKVKRNDLESRMYGALHG